jgi:uroporphyrinogen-III synthase
MAPNLLAQSSMSSRPRVALLEARMSRELARLIEKHGGEPHCVPAVQECGQELHPDRARQLIKALGQGDYEIAVFMTGVAVSLLFETAERLQLRPELVAGLRLVTTVCRGPKPTAALRGFGVVPTLTAREAFTSAEVLDALASVELKGRRVLLFHYGERSDALAETLLACEAILEELWLYRWRLPDDTSDLEGLVSEIIAGQVDALAVTCQIQFRHLFQVAEKMGLEGDLVRALNDRVVVGVVGPTCHAILQVHGVAVDVMPEHPKMGPMVAALMRHLDRNPGHRSLPDAGASPS